MLVSTLNVRWFNYALYGGMSRRVYQVLAERLPQVEPYSIDEMFLDLGVPGTCGGSARSCATWYGVSPRS